MDKLLLHCCCAPCANQPIDELLAGGYQLGLFYMNPNIQPRQEYGLRRDCLAGYASSLGLPYWEDEYNPGRWYQAVGNDGGVFAYTAEESLEEMRARRSVRCRLCYAHRFQALARLAAELGYDSISSSLLVSPYQFHELLAEELIAAAGVYGLKALTPDWRPVYRQGQDKARELGFYRQRYCGCEFSYQEADIERAYRLEAKAKAKARAGAGAGAGAGADVGAGAGAAFGGPGS